MPQLETSSPTPLQELLEKMEQTTILRFSTAGSVDDGKSTLIGRLLYDSKNIYEDTLEAIAKTSAKDGGPLSLALLTDGLKAEREQGITIDVAYRYFSTPRRRFILADSPGHEQYTRNMATAASTADLTIILIDAKRGVLTQTKRHAFIASLLGVPRLLVAINKMDLVNFSEEKFNEISAQFSEFAAKLEVKEIRFIPVSALEGDNITQRSQHMPWYSGETVMSYLENVYVGSDHNPVDFRFPIQTVIRPNQNFRGYAGRVFSGSIQRGEEVLVLPSKRSTRIRSIEYMASDPTKCSLEQATTSQSVVISLEDEIDISRGDMLVRPRNLPKITQEVDSLLLWMGEMPLDPRKEYILRHTSRETRVRIEGLSYRIDVNTLSRTEATVLSLNEIGRIRFSSRAPLFLDSYRQNRATGNFILIDPDTYSTLGAGMILDRVPATKDYGISASNLDLHKEESLIGPREREQRAGYPAKTLWMTGLSGAGKSTLAKLVELQLFKLGRPIFRLDGDNLRTGLNRGLGFSKEDRSENIRRVAEVAKLFNDAGVSVICSFISPYRQDRAQACQIIGRDRFIELYISTPLLVCEQRDPHGMYKKAKAGKLQEFTGVSAPYEAPENPALIVDTSICPIEDGVAKILDYLEKFASKVG